MKSFFPAILFFLALSVAAAQPAGEHVPARKYFEVALRENQRGAHLHGCKIKLYVSK